MRDRDLPEAGRVRIETTIALGMGAALVLTLFLPGGAIAVSYPSHSLSAGPIVPARSTSSLQAQIDSAAPGATVYFGAGTWVGQLWINRSVEIVGAGVNRTILQSPAVMVPDALDNVFEVEIGHHASVSITHLTVRVTEQCMLANSIGVATGGGIGVRDNATLDLWSVNLVAYGSYPDLNQPCTTGAGNAGMLSFGRAVSIGLDDPPGVGTAVQVEGHGSIERVHTTGFDIFSISVGGVRGPSHSTASILDNVVTVGPGPYTAAYGIVAYGVSVIEGNVVVGTPGSDGGIAVVFTSAIVTHNVVRDFTCLNAPFPISPPCGIDPLFDDQDLGIFLASIDPSTIVEHNLIESVDAGILIEGPGAPATVEQNTIVDSTYYGLDLIDANQTFQQDIVTGGAYAIAVGAAGANTTATLSHDEISGYSDALALLEANYPWVAAVVVRGS